jgi:hypothetical protein
VTVAIELTGQIRDVEVRFSGQVQVACQSEL